MAVLILFFNRPDHLKEVFDEVRKARPAKLFLYQDGPRGDRDLPGIEACREVVADRSTGNVRCTADIRRRTTAATPRNTSRRNGPSAIVDKCVVLEDDDVPSQSFFPFCKEMLDRYEHDERITMVCGFNTDEEQTTDAGRATTSSRRTSASGAGHRGGASSTSGTSTIRGSTTDQTHAPA